MKKLLKSEVCRSREQCTGALFMGEKSITMLKKKRERERETKRGNADADVNPNTHKECEKRE